MVVMHETLDINAIISNDGTLTFNQAIKDKYVNQEEFDNRLVLPGDQKISTEITFVGFGKVSSIQKQLVRLASIDLSGRRIASAGCLNELRGSLNRVQLLNLADNLVSWQDIISIISCLPNLRELILTNNPLSFAPTVTSPETPHRALISLTLGKTCLSWTSSIEVLSQIWIRIEQLDLWKCSLTPAKMVLDPLETSRSLVQNIQVLKLSHNSFDNIDWLAHAGPFTNLIELDLSNCILQYINLNETLVKQLQNLRTLNISYNKLTDWRSISNLHALKNLRTLICHENPLFTQDSCAKSHTIGRLGQIESLNREEISKTMRRDAEIFYLRKVFMDYQLYKKGDNEDFALNHPRYGELIEFYGVPEDLLEKKVFEKYVSINLCYNDKTITKKLPFDMRISNLRMLCKRLFRIIPSADIQITCNAEPEDSTLNYLLDQDGQTLHFFSVKNGQKLVIEEIM